MTILNRPTDGLPSVLLTLWKCMRLRRSPYEKDELQNLCAPKTLGTLGIEADPQQQVRQTITRWGQLGLWRIEGGKIKLEDQFKSIRVDEDEKANFESFRSACLSLVLKPDNSRGLNKGQSGKSADFCFAACWMLSQDVFTCPGGSHDSIEGPLEKKQVFEKPYPFGNNTRWDGFRDWAVFFGLGYWTRARTGRVFNADPAEAIRVRLTEVFGSKEELTQDAFFSALRDLLPILDQGDLRTKSEKNFGGTWRAPQANEVSPSLTRALFRLEQEGIVKIARPRDDAQSGRRTFLGRDYTALPRTVTHFIKGPRL
jgi:hypothetical protein